MTSAVINFYDYKNPKQYIIMAKYYNIFYAINILF